MLILPSLYLAPVSYYAALYRADYAVEDCGEHFIKQTYRNRCQIATAEGALSLTIPVQRGGASRSAMKDIRLSDHGNWRRLHWQAIRTAYDASPYFFYYADDFAEIYERDHDYLVDFNADLRNLVLSLLSLEDKAPKRSETYIHAETDDTDLRTLMTPKTSVIVPDFEPRPYYQVFRERTGFLPDMSIIDLLFNHGPESRLFLA